MENNIKMQSKTNSDHRNICRISIFTFLLLNTKGHKNAKPLNNTNDISAKVCYTFVLPRRPTRFGLRWKRRSWWLSTDIPQMYSWRESSTTITSSCYSYQEVHFSAIPQIPSLFAQSYHGIFGAVCPPKSPEKCKRHGHGCDRLWDLQLDNFFCGLSWIPFLFFIHILFNQAVHPIFQRNYFAFRYSEHFWHYKCFTDKF